MCLLSGPADLSTLWKAWNPGRQPTLCILHPPPPPGKTCSSLPPTQAQPAAAAERCRRWILSREGLPLRVLMGKTRRAPGAGEGGAGLRGAPVHIQNAKQLARASAVWPAAAGTLCSQDVAGLKRPAGRVERKPDPGKTQEEGPGRGPPLSGFVGGGPSGREWGPAPGPLLRSPRRRRRASGHLCSPASDAGDQRPPLVPSRCRAVSWDLDNDPRR